MSRASPILRSPIYSNPARYRFVGAPPSQQPAAKPNVISIPVHFVGSDDVSKKRTDRAAVGIQKAFWGFLVRKNVGIAREIEAEVDGIEMRFRREQEMDLIVRDERERVRINEMLMRLLFRLDSVRGVRDYRKRVIRRVIALQEMLDSISVARSADQTLEPVAETKPGDSGDLGEGVKTLGDGDQAIEMAESKEELEELKPIEEFETLETLETGDQIDPMEMHREAGVDNAETLESGEQISTGWELLETRELDDAEAEKNQESVMEEETIPESTVDSLSSQEVRTEKSVGDGTPAGSVKEEEETGMKDVMERMVVENEKLKGLVALLCERSAQQCRLMGGLVQRVEHLERMMEKMERRKKRKVSSSHKRFGRDNNKQL